MILRKLEIGAGFLTFGQIVQAIVAFGANLVLVRHLLPEEFGRFALILSSITIVFGFITLNVKTLILRTTKNTFGQDKKRIYFSIISYETIFGCLIATIWLLNFDTIGAWELSLILILAVRHWLNANLGFYEREMPFKNIAVIETSGVIFGHLAAVLLVLKGYSKDLLYMREAIITGVMIAMFGLTGGVRFFRMVSPWKVPWKNIFFEVKPLWLDTFLENSFNRIVIVLIAFYGGERLAGFFFQAQRLAALPLQCLTPLVSRVAAVWFGATEERTLRKEGRNRLLLFLAMPLGLLGIMCFYLSENLVPWLFGYDWAKSCHFLSLMFGVVVFSSLFEVLKSYCWQSRQMRWLLVSRITQYFGMGLSLAFFYVGIFNVGEAFCIGQSLAFCASFLSLLIILERVERNW